jgi:enoyl-CoA hydratase/carnithine racemase
LCARRTLRNISIPARLPAGTDAPDENKRNPLTSLPQLKDSALACDGRVAVLTFRRDDVRNALTGTELVSDIVDTLAWANASGEVSVLIMTGEGNAFSAGGNIKTMGERAKAPPFELQQNYRRGIQRVPLAIQEADVPIIAAVNGAAIGAGFDLANMCDIRIGSVNAQFGETFVNLGIIPGDAGAWYLRRLLGYQRAAELLFTGRIVKAEEARALGILLEVTAPDELMPRARELAGKIAAKPPLAVRYTKRLLKAAQSQRLEEHLDLCAAFQAICHKTEDHAEALAAFFEKRPGVFKGK